MPIIPPFKGWGPKVCCFVGILHARGGLSLDSGARLWMSAFALRQKAQPSIMIQHGSFPI